MPLWVKVGFAIAAILFAGFIWCLLKIASDADDVMLDADGERRRESDRQKIRDSRRAS